LVDTDANPEIIDYPIPGNDDSIKSVKYITSCLVESINEGLEKREDISRMDASKSDSEDDNSQKESELKAEEDTSKEKAQTD